jgi:prepilin-type N-terminal cleavage/methylation domain-containing protein
MKGAPLPREQAFTLLELLIVMAIVAILVGIAAAALNRTIRNNQVAEGAQAFAASLQSARNSSQRDSLGATLAWVGSGVGQSFSSYTVTRGTQPRTQGLPSGIVAKCVLLGTLTGCATNSLGYSAPYAEVTAGAIFQVFHSTDSGARPLFVKVGGVTGKVIVSESQ